jgi:hypothetical protein
MNQFAERARRVHNILVPGANQGPLVANFQSDSCPVPWIIAENILHVAYFAGFWQL